MSELQKRVVICVNHISQDCGGLASMARLTAKVLAENGFIVDILTRVDDGLFKCPNVKIHRCPSLLQSLKSILHADYVICEGAIFRLCWPLMFVPKKSMVVKHGVRNSSSVFRRIIEYWLSLNCKWTAVSEFVAEKEFIKSTVVPNAYDPAVFRPFNAAKRDKDLIFVGSLTEEKGVFVLLEAVEKLLKAGKQINWLTLVGGGCEHNRILSKWERSLHELGCQLRLTGNVNSHEVARLLNCHKVLVAPSMNIRWEEAFGLVALEGLACGCKVVVSNSGGLPEALGSCGFVSKCGDVDDLSRCIEDALDPTTNIDKGRVKMHLSKYTPDRLLDAYLKILK